MKPIIIAGAVDTELDFLLEKIEHTQLIKEKGYIFYEGSINNYPVVLIKTGVGTINSAISTMIAINKYNPIAIINEGTAGSHKVNLNKGDLIIGKEVVAINSFRTLPRDLNEGSEPFNWKMTDFQDTLDSDCTIYKADELLLEIAQDVKKIYTYGKVYDGRIGSGDVFNKEIDRINWIHKNLNTSCEEMEGISVYIVAKKFNIPVIAFRVISNNEIIKQGYDTTYGEYSQEFTYNFLKKYIDNLLRG